MKRFALCAIIASFALMMAPYIAGAQGDAEKTATENGLTVTVKKMADEIKGFKTFAVVAETTSGAKKTLNGRICLEDQTRKQPPCGSGECTIYMELGAGEKKTMKKDCKEASRSNVWSVKIVKVYDF